MQIVTIECGDEAFTLPEHVLRRACPVFPESCTVWDLGELVYQEEALSRSALVIWSRFFNGDLDLNWTPSIQDCILLLEACDVFETPQEAIEESWLQSRSDLSNFFSSAWQHSAAVFASQLTRFLELTLRRGYRTLLRLFMSHVIFTGESLPHIDTLVDVLVERWIHRPP